MKSKPDVPPEIALLLEKRETIDRRAPATTKPVKPKAAGAGGTTEKNAVERRRRNRRKS